MVNPLYQKHIISINDLSREDLELTLRVAASLKANPQPELLKHKVIASCFFEASTGRVYPLKPRCIASVPLSSVLLTATTRHWEKGRNAGRHHFRHQPIRECHRNASPAGRRFPPCDRVLRRYSDSERWRRREPTPDADAARFVHHSGNAGPTK